MRSIHHPSVAVAILLLTTTQTVATSAILGAPAFVNCGAQAPAAPWGELISTPIAAKKDVYNDFQQSSPVDFSMNPSSVQSRAITSSLGIGPEQHDALVALAALVVEWNERLNLISRRDCTEDVVFGRHILPSVALAALPGSPFSSAEEDREVRMERKRVVDVGTGGGFPGLPLAIAFPDVDFLLVDSVGKKLGAVRNMANELGLRNIQTHHGRAEYIVDDALEGPRHRGAYDVCVGRSVAALPRFCFWVSDLLKKGDREGKLIYIVGGEIDETIQERADTDIFIDDLIGHVGASDKRALIIGATDVVEIAAASGETKKKIGPGKKKKSNPKRATNKTKGTWQKRDNSVPKQRGYENFQRYQG